MNAAEKTEQKKRTLSEIVEEFRRVLHTLDDAEGEVLPELEDELRNCEDSLVDKVDRCLWVAKEAEAQARVWADRAKMFTERAKVLNSQADRLEDYVLWAMTTVHVDKLETQNFMVAVQKSPDSVVVDNEEEFTKARILEGVELLWNGTHPFTFSLLKKATLIDLAVPPKFIRVKLEVDKRALLAALKAGETIEFTRLVTDKVHLRIK